MDMIWRCSSILLMCTHMACCTIHAWLWSAFISLRLTPITKVSRWAGTLKAVNLILFTKHEAKHQFNTGNSIPFSIVGSKIIYQLGNSSLMYILRRSAHRSIGCAYSAISSMLAWVWAAFIDVGFTSATTKPSYTEAGIALDTILQNSNIKDISINSKQHNICCII